MMLHSLRYHLRRERPRVMFAIRGALAALAALTVAVLLKLESPFWAAMTAIATHDTLEERSYSWKSRGK